MVKMFTTNKPAINMTIVGFGQAGNRMADKFAEIKDENGDSVYNCLALNSNTGDMEGLQHIPQENKVSLELGGLGKNPEVAIKTLENNEDASNRLNNFIRKNVRPSDDLVLFFAGLGGGTGTSTIIKAINEFYTFNNKPLINKVLKKIQEAVPPAEFKTNLKKYVAQASKKAEPHFKKIGIVVTLPTRDDGPDVLRQVNDFAQQIWDISRQKNKGIAFVMFADNQHFLDEFRSLEPKDRNGLLNYRDYANTKLVEAFHELNTATTGGGTSYIFDEADFRRLILEHTGSLVINKESKNYKDITKGQDIVDMFVSGVTGSTLHQPIKLRNDDGSIAKVHHAGLLAIVEEKNAVIGDSFIDEARSAVNEILPYNGTLFSGYLTEKNDRETTTYTFYKTDALPERLAKGLVEEWKEYKARQSETNYSEAKIEKIKTDEDEDFDYDIDLSDFEDFIGESEKNVAATKESDILDIDDLDIDKLLND